MGCLTYSYVAIVLVLGVHAIFNGEWAGIAGTLAPLLAFIAGGGIANARRKAGNLFLIPVGIGFLILCLAIYWIHNSGWNVSIFDYKFSGTDWCIIGFGIGLIYGAGLAKKPPSTFDFRDPEGDADSYPVDIHSARAMDFEVVAREHADATLRWLLLAGIVWWLSSVWWALLPSAVSFLHAIRAIGGTQAAGALRKGKYRLWNPNNGAPDGDYSKFRRTGPKRSYAEGENDDR